MREADNEVKVTVDELRDFFEDDELPEELVTALDQAQGDVASGKTDQYFLLITVSK